MIKNPAVEKKWLIFFCGIIWSCVGILLNLIAFNYCYMFNSSKIIITVISGIVLGFLIAQFGFSKIVNTNIIRIMSYNREVCLFAFQDWRSYILIPIMIGTGIFMRKASFIPKQWISIIYIGIGLALFFESIIYYKNFLTLGMNKSE